MFSKKQTSRTQTRGQSFVELALLFPVLLIMLSGVIEFGFLLNQYLALLDAARNAARFASDSLYYLSDNDHNCTTTRDFYRQTACLVNQELRQEQPFITLNDNGTDGDTSDDYLDPVRGDEILISAFSITQGSGVTARHPGGSGEDGWSYALDLPAYAVRNGTSSFPTARINNGLDGSAPSTGFVLVEIYYHYDQALNLPWITAFINDPIPLNTYSLMPLVSAEPTPTPMP